MVAERLVPSWEQINAFHNPLTEGERTLIEYLDEYLPPAWEIYVQPYMNNDRPDIVLLHPQVGAQIIEVKDWASGLYSRHEEAHVSGENRDTASSAIRVRDKNGDEWVIASPIAQVSRYRSNLIKLYMPYVGEAIDEDPKRLAVVRISIYFHNMSTWEANQLIGRFSSHCVIFGRDLLESKDGITRVVPDVQRMSSAYFNEEIASTLRTWLVPPFHAVEQGTVIELTKQQQKYSTPQSGKKQVLSGVPGSGKTLVLAQRAARLASEGKTVLVITFNITLWHYVRDQISRAPFAFDWHQIEVRHFHGFCSELFNKYNVPRPMKDGSDEIFVRIKLPEAVLNFYNSHPRKRRPCYDAILIDEGQDYEELWYDVLELFLKPKGQVLFVADERQNLYERDLTWIATRFEALPALRQSYRLPSSAIDQANIFASHYLEETLTKAIQLALPFDSRQPHLIWRDISDFETAREKVWLAFDWMRRSKRIHPADIVILVPSHTEGLILVDDFEAHNIKVNHVFDVGENKKRKHSFWMGDSRVKMCTIHSFKGWELINVILLTHDDQQAQNEAVDRNMYVALTRTRQNLIVFNRVQRYQEFGAQWPNTWD